MDTIIEDGTVNFKYSKVIPAKRWQILRRLLRIDSFTEMMPNLKRIEVLEKRENTVIVKWLVDIDGIPVSWTEEEVFDFENYSIKFKAIEGDFSLFDGEWILHDEGEYRTRVEIKARVRIGIPMVENLIAQALGDKLFKNFNIMLETLNTQLITKRYDMLHKGQPTNIKGFAMIGHPYNFNHLVRHFQHFKQNFETPSRDFLLKIYEMLPSYVMRNIQHIESKANVETNGLMIVSTFIPDMVKMNPEIVVDKVIDACRLAEEHQIGIVALGGFTSIVGERYGQKIIDSVNVPITTGNTFTSALAIDGVIKAAELIELGIENAKVVIIGGTGDIGSACATVLCRRAKEVVITGRQEESVKNIVNALQSIATSKISGTLDNAEAVKDADIIIAAASTSSSILDIDAFKSGAIVCDLAYPKNISYRATARKDILIFSGGLCQLPFELDLGFEVGLPSNDVLYGCFSECVLLDLEGMYESFSYGRGNITPEKINQIREIGIKHGFVLAPFFWGDKPVTEEMIKEIRSHITV